MTTKQAEEVERFAYELYLEGAKLSGSLAEAALRFHRKLSAPKSAMLARAIAEPDVPPALSSRLR